MESRAGDIRWVVFVNDYGWRHVVPHDDLREHDLTEACWCHPDEDDGTITHNSLDGREAYQLKLRKLQ